MYKLAMSFHRGMCSYQNAVEMLVLGTRVLTVGRPTWVKTFVDPFLIVVVTSVRFGCVLSSEKEIKHNKLLNYKNIVY